MKSKKVLILIDWKLKASGWSFLRAISAYGHRFTVYDADLPYIFGSRWTKLLSLWPGYLKLALSAFRDRNKYDVILTWQGVVGLWYGFLRRATCIKGPGLILMGFFFTKRKSKIYYQLRYHFVKFALSGVDRVICYSIEDVEFFSRLFKCDHSKFVFCPFGIDTHRSNLDQALKVPNENYIFSAGSSNRDYETLFKAVENLDCRVIVIAKRYNIKGLSIPKNVDIKLDVWGDDYYQIFCKSLFVVIPLDDEEVSSGQMVLLDAMLYEKAVITAESHGTVDYIRSGENGLFYQPHNIKDLQQKIYKLLSDSELRKKIAKNARRMVQVEFNMENFTRKISNIISII